MARVGAATTKAALAGVFLVGLSPMTPARATDPIAASEERAHCAVLVSAAAPGAASTVLKRACSAVSGTAALASLRDASTNTEVVAIMTFYEHENFRGGSLTVTGDSGPCDGAGYHYTSDVFDYWGRNLSSIGRNDPSCNTVDIAADPNRPRETRALPAPNIGQANDNFSEIRVYRR